ncbi:hypothetical protein SSX86_012562 [Deinandra increscens subsp. villosa]|uniref:RING-type E3 ubiquitin transferase n=1 Tax=Deinandra increscens subsp. villosa TaxID=3103831 RepID=A0AAP0D8R0_9ASTR
MNMSMEDPISIGSDSNSQTLSSTTSFFTPLLISIMGICVTALALLIYHLLLVRYCIRRHAARMAALRTYAGGEDVPTGVDEKTLLTIPVITYNRSGSDWVMTGQSECAVCLGDLEDGDRVRLLPSCKHLFHVTCIDEWFVGHTSCPVCRVPVVAPDDQIHGCPVCRSAETTLDDVVSSVGLPDNPPEVDHRGGLTFGPSQVTKLRHCHSLVLPGEKKGRLTGMELKRSLSMGQSGSVIIDINIDNVDKDCMYYSSFRDESVRQFQRVSLKVKQSVSRMCVGQGHESSVLPY